MNDALIKDYYRAFNERRLTDAAALFTADADIELVPGKPERGGAGYLRVADTWLAAFPDARFAVERVDQRTEHICEVYLMATGTHRGTLDFGAYRFKPTGTDAALHVRELLEVHDGKITNSVLTVALTDLIAQLTAIDYDELTRRVERICALREPLAHADGERRRDVANQLGAELDAARRAVRPHYG